MPRVFCTGTAASMSLQWQLDVYASDIPIRQRQLPERGKIKYITRIYSHVISLLIRFFAVRQCRFLKDGYRNAGLNTARA